MPQVVPTEVGDACAAERRFPGLSVNVPHGLPSMREHETGVFPHLPSQDQYCLRVQRYPDRLTPLGVNRH